MGLFLKIHSLLIKLVQFIKTHLFYITLWFLYIQVSPGAWYVLGSLFCATGLFIYCWTLSSGLNSQFIMSWCPAEWVLPLYFSPAVVWLLLAIFISTTVLESGWYITNTHLAHIQMEFFCIVLNLRFILRKTDTWKLLLIFPIIEKY